MWIVAAILSAFFAGLTAIFAKCGIKKTDSDIVTALRTVVVLFFAWGIVFLTGSMQNMKNIEPNSLFFLILSGLATGASWLCYFKALSTGDVNKVVPIDKSSTVLVVLTAIAIFHETDHLTVKLAGTSLLAIGIWQMLPKQPPAVPDKSPDPNRSWIIYAVLSAVFAALTSILAKIGVTGIHSNLATAIRTGIVLVMAFVLLIVKGKLPQRKNIHRERTSFYRSFRAHNGNLLALLLLCDPEWRRECCRAYRQTEYRSNHLIFLPRIKRKTGTAGLGRTFSYGVRHSYDGSVGIRDFIYRIGHHPKIDFHGVPAGWLDICPKNIYTIYITYVRFRRSFSYAKITTNFGSRI